MDTLTTRKNYIKDHKKLFRLVTGGTHTLDSHTISYIHAELISTWSIDITMSEWLHRLYVNLIDAIYILEKKECDIQETNFLNQLKIVIIKSNKIELV